MNNYLGYSDGSQFSFIGDFNGDGKADVLHGDIQRTNNCLYLSNGDGSFTKSTNFNMSNEWLGDILGEWYCYIGDFNGDGKSDILLKIG